MYYYILVVILILYIIYDVNYVLRTLFTILSGRMLEKSYSLHDPTTIYGICTYLDCDESFRSLRLARLLREIDIARFHFYDRTGIYERSQILKISSLQGCTLSTTCEPVGLFQIYKITTKLVYWDDRSLFLEHEVATLSDGKLRHVIVSRQHPIGKDRNSTEALLHELKGAENSPSCPEYISHWIRSNEISSLKFKKI
ncbi:protein THEM6-like [Plodia interpunctella]|uniref:protein THEM6-like n=1 Tax=Plodia interpunctella TaxID=58824 RepID=UPI002367880F|nr:protein THEM6-like [Plodia interpunctella]